MTENGITNNQAYEQRVRALAEKMGKAAYARKHGHIPTQLTINQVEPYLEYARIAVAEMAQIASDILSVTTDYNGDALQAELKFRGLIPDSGPVESSQFTKFMKGYSSGKEAGEHE